MVHNLQGRFPSFRKTSLQERPSIRQKARKETTNDAQVKRIYNLQGRIPNFRKIILARFLKACFKNKQEIQIV
jgi:hypothetical protein